MTKNPHNQKPGSRSFPTQITFPTKFRESTRCIFQILHLFHSFSAIWARLHRAWNQKAGGYTNEQNTGNILYQETHLGKLSVRVLQTVLTASSGERVHVSPTNLYINKSFLLMSGSVLRTPRKVIYARLSGLKLSHISRGISLFICTLHRTMFYLSWQIV